MELPMSRHVSVVEMLGPDGQAIAAGMDSALEYLNTRGTKKRWPEENF